MTSDDRLIPFNRPTLRGGEIASIQAAVENLHLSGNGPFSARCIELLESFIGSDRVFLTPSATAGLEMAALLLDLQPGDEVIVPSFTFPTTASAFALRGAIPVFVDVRDDTLNIDERLIEAAITDRTRAIVPVHYAGVGCEMDVIGEIADRHGLAVVEDAAQGVLASYRGRPLGSFGELAALSFHETKNVFCGEGGALLVNDPALIERAEILQEKGTNRSAFFRGDVDKYTWVDLGSSFLMSDLDAAFLYAQLAEARAITDERLRIWNAFHAAFEEIERAGLVRRPVVPGDRIHNAHMYYLLIEPPGDRDAVIRHMRSQDVHAVFHYVPLHSSPAGRRFGRTDGDLPVSTTSSDRLMRLPLWCSMTEVEIERVVAATTDAVHAALTESVAAPS